MGYSSLKVGSKTLKAFLNTKNVYEWLKEGYYDLKYASEPFVWKLVEVLGIPLDIASADIEKAKKRYQTLSLMKDPYLRVEVNIDSSRVSFFSAMLAFSKGRIEIHKESLVYRSHEEIFMKVGELVRKHYRESKGELPVFGKITHYLYDHIDGNRYRFTIDGKLINENKEIKEGK
jgi:cobalamin-dependent methionine synthase I